MARSGTATDSASRWTQTTTVPCGVTEATGSARHTEFWHLPRERLTIAMTWNDDVLDREGRILPTLLRAALGYRK